MKSRQKALVIETEPEIGKALLSAMHGFYDARVVSDGEDAMRFIIAERPVVVWVGERVPGFDPAKVAVALRLEKIETPLVAVLSRADPVRDAALIEAGYIATLTYPFPARLARAIADRAATIVREKNGIRSLLHGMVNLHLHIIAFDLLDGVTIRSFFNAAASSDPVLVVGERGSGKETLLRAIHMSGPKAIAPIETVNVRDVQDGDLRERLFGAHGRPGAIERANGGTIIIRGIGEIAPDIQERIAHLIRRGSSDARFCFTTRLDLHGAALRGEMNRELWEILGPLSIHLPPLRERLKDLPEIARRMTSRIAARLDSPVTGVHGEAMKLLLKHDWPGNLVELEKVIALAVSRSSGKLITTGDLVELKPVRDLSPMDEYSLDEILSYKLNPLVASTDETPDGNLHELVVGRVEKTLLDLVLKKFGGHRSKAAAALGIHRNTLRTLLKDR